MFVRGADKASWAENREFSLFSSFSLKKDLKISPVHLCLRVGEDKASRAEQREGRQSKAGRRQRVLSILSILSILFKKGLKDIPSTFMFIQKNTYAKQLFSSASHTYSNKIDLKITRDT